MLEVLVAATQYWIKENGELDISIMAVAVGMYLSLKMTIPIFIGGLIKMYVDKRFENSLKKNNPDLFKIKNKMKLDAVKEKSHGPGILFASGLTLEAIMGIGLVRWLSPAFISDHKRAVNLSRYSCIVGCAMLMARFSLEN